MHLISTRLPVTLAPSGVRSVHPVRLVLAGAILFVLVGAAHGQGNILPQAPDISPVQLPATTDAPSGPVEIALSRDGGYAVVRGDDVHSDGVPDDLTSRLRSFLETGKHIDAIAFTPPGGWTVIAEDFTWVQNINGPFRKQLRQLIDDGRTIHDVAFNPIDWATQRGYVIAHEKGATVHNIPDELRKKLTLFLGAGRTIDTIAFAADGSWAFVCGDLASISLKNQTLSPFESRLKGMLEDGQEIHDLSFGKSEQYVAASDQQFTAHNLPDGLPQVLGEDLALDRESGGLSPEAVAEMAPDFDQVNLSQGTRLETITETPASTIQTVARQQAETQTDKEQKDPQDAAGKPRAAGKDQSDIQQQTEPAKLATKDMRFALTDFNITQAQENSGDDVGVLAIAYRGTPGRGGKVWYSRGFSDMDLLTNTSSDDTFLILVDEHVQTFSDMKPYELVGLMIFFVERDKNKNESIRNAVKLAANDVENSFAKQMNDLTPANPGQSRLAQKRAAGELLEVAESVAASTRDHLADRLIENVPRKVNATDRSTDFYALWHTYTPELSDTEIATLNETDATFFKPGRRILAVKELTATSKGPSGKTTAEDLAIGATWGLAGEDKDVNWAAEITFATK